MTEWTNFILCILLHLTQQIQSAGCWPFPTACISSPTLVSLNFHLCHKLNLVVPPRAEEYWSMYLEDKAFLLVVDI